MYKFFHVIQCQTCNYTIKVYYLECLYSAKHAIITIKVYYLNVCTVPNMHLYNKGLLSKTVSNENLSAKHLTRKHFGTNLIITATKN